MNHVRLLVLVATVACSGSTTGVDGGSGNDSGACPDEQGLYSLAFSGQGCGTVATTAPICIAETSCTITLTTKGAGGGNEISGTTPIGADGSFSGAAITE